MKPTKSVYIKVKFLDDTSIAAYKIEMDKIYWKQDEDTITEVKQEELTSYTPGDGFYTLEYAIPAKGKSNDLVILSKITSKARML